MQSREEQLGGRISLFQIFKCNDPVWILYIRHVLSQNKLVILQKFCLHIEQEELSLVSVEKKTEETIDQMLGNKNKF